VIALGAAPSALAVSVGPTQSSSTFRTDRQRHRRSVRPDIDDVTDVPAGRSAPIISYQSPPLSTPPGA
jgi:hypothetical protein